MRPKCRCLAIMQRYIWWKPNTAACQHKHVGLFCSHRTWAPCSHWVDHEFLCRPKLFESQ